MKKQNLIISVFLATTILFSGCKTASNATKGGLLGGGAGAALGAGIGLLVGKDKGKSAAIGAAVGAAVGATTGVIIGKKMDKAAAEAAAIEGAKVETITDANNLQAVKVTFESGILFSTGKSTLSKGSIDALTKFSNILVQNPTMDISIMGHTDNTGSLEVNQKLSKDRAQAVADFLLSKTVPAKQLKEVTGKDFSQPIADNATKDGKAANRRVEIYLYASKEMIDAAQKEVNN
jgi:outer membrane protein OmpA-like peptidoglycan-associated protein